VCATSSKWKPKYGGLDVSDAKRAESLRDENAKPKKLLAQALFDNAMLRDIASKKDCDPPPGGSRSFRLACEVRERRATIPRLQYPS
jgi:putative transposase